MYFAIGVRRIWLYKESCYFYTSTIRCLFVMLHTMYWNKKWNCMPLRTDAILSKNRCYTTKKCKTQNVPWIDTTLIVCWKCTFCESKMRCREREYIEAFFHHLFMIAFSGRKASFSWDLLSLCWHHYAIIKVV